jgi:phosphoribosylformimino-5-aminoimidazole carboxamide ribotide isomerase
VQASGGVSSLDDLERLQTDGAIIGKALWEGKISLEEALGLARA